MDAKYAKKQLEKVKQLVIEIAEMKDESLDNLGKEKKVIAKFIGVKQGLVCSILSNLFNEDVITIKKGK